VDLRTCHFGIPQFAPAALDDEVPPPRFCCSVVSSVVLERGRRSRIYHWSNVSVHIRSWTDLPPRSPCLPPCDEGSTARMYFNLAQHRLPRTTQPHPLKPNCPCTPTACLSTWKPTMSFALLWIPSTLHHPSHESPILPLQSTHAKRTREISELAFTADTNVTVVVSVYRSSTLGRTFNRRLNERLVASYSDRIGKKPFHNSAAPDPVGSSSHESVYRGHNSRPVLDTYLRLIRIPHTLFPIYDICFGHCLPEFANLSFGTHLHGDHRKLTLGNTTIAVHRYSTNRNSHLART